MSSRSLTVMVMTLGLALSAAPVRSEDETPEWARDFALFVFGGPPAGVVEITLNGEFAAQVVEGVPPRIEVADLLKAGINELRLEFAPAEAEAEAEAPAGRPLTVRIARSEKVTPFQDVIKDAIVEIEVPREPPATTCTETVRFWAGPPAVPPAGLKDRYWLIVEGPPVSHRVSVVLNGVPVHSANSGDRFFEITKHVRKGKNEVTYEATPTCLVRKSGRSGPLRLHIAAGVQNYDTVTFEGPPLAAFDLPLKRNPKPITRAQAFRGK